MASFKSFFKKKHKYETQSDLKDMTAEQIVSLNPSDVKSNIEKETGGIPLTGVKKRALNNLLAQKRIEKESGPNPIARERVIDAFLKRENLRHDPKVTKLLVETNSEIMRNNVSMRDNVRMKELENRLRRLNDEPEIPYTDEEKLYLRMSKLNIGGKTRRHRSHKTKKRKSHRKRRTYKRK